MYALLTHGCCTARSSSPPQVILLSNGKVGLQGTRPMPWGPAAQAKRPPAHRPPLLAAWLRSHVQCLVSLVDSC